MEYKEAIGRTINDCFGDNFGLMLANDIFMNVRKGQKIETICRNCRKKVFEREPVITILHNPDIECFLIVAYDGGINIFISEVYREKDLRKIRSYIESC